MEEKKLFEEFPPITTKEWLDRITSDLKGADFNRKLVWKTNEGFDVMPFYRKEDLEGIRVNTGAVQKSDPRWLVRQNINVLDYEDANRKALSLLERGVDSLGFIIKDPTAVSEDNIIRLLKDIDPRLAELNFLSEGMAREIVAFLRGIFSERDPDHSQLRGCIEADPLGRLMANGTLCIPEEKGFDYLASLTLDTITFPSFRNIQVNGSAFKNAGSDSARELGFSLSMAVEYLDQLTRRGLSPGTIAGKIRFSFGIGPDYFIEIAKLRAARILWNLILNKYIPATRSLPSMLIHSVTTEWNSTAYDPYVNMLRTQTEAMSAVLGGTDSLTVNPYDTAFSDAGEFSERIARNQQLILREEAALDKVADPSAGAYYIEKMTAMIADAAWKKFLEVEERGGFLFCLKSGFIQDSLSEIAAKRFSDISARKEVLVGINKYPDLEEDAFPDARISPEKASPGELNVRPVVPVRGSEEVERLRIAVGKSSRCPKVFMLTTGNPVFARARAQFSAGFFRCAGYRIMDNEVFRDPGDGIRSALEAKADIIVVCSSDEEYRKVAPEVFRAVEGKAIVVVAGNPESIDELKAAGIRNFISIRSNLVESLKYYNTLLGIN
jgi:methylmalonyl-CoA mutase